MNQFKLSVQAAQDIENIWDYIASDSIDAADSVQDKLREKFVLIARFPELGRLRSDLASSLRGFPVGDYIIFYRSTEHSTEIVRVLHGSRDLRRIFLLEDDTETLEDFEENS